MPAPTVSNPTSAHISSTSATLGGNVTDGGDTSITARGVVYDLNSENTDPKLDVHGVTNVTTQGTTGVFTVNTPRLESGKVYSFAAYATNSAGTTYSPVSKFKTLALSDSEELHPSNVRWKQEDKIIAFSGYLLVGTSFISFGAIAIIKFLEAMGRIERAPAPVDTNWIALALYESTSLSLLAVGVISAMIGKGLLTNARTADARAIPETDLPLIRTAVMAGTPEPIDQYVRLRSLSGMSGTFTKVGITGLPLTTVFLTLVFSAISLMAKSPQSESFLDLAKLTLGAFIGSFVQRQVEQRRQESAADQQGTTPPRPGMPV